MYIWIRSQIHATLLYRTQRGPKSRFSSDFWYVAVRCWAWGQHPSARPNLRKGQEALRRSAKSPCTPIGVEDLRSLCERKGFSSCDRSRREACYGGSVENTDARFRHRSSRLSHWTILPCFFQPPSSVQAISTRSQETTDKELW